MTAKETWKAGKVWSIISFSGGKETPLLGNCKLTSKGPMDPDTAFLIYMLCCGQTVKEAQNSLKKAKKDEQ